MLRKNQTRLCYILVCFILLAGMYTTYEKVGSIEKHTVATHKTTLQIWDKSASHKTIYVVERAGCVLRESIGRVVQRNQFLRRGLRTLSLFFCALCAECFILKCQLIEEIFPLWEKKYRKAVIKYIHDMDGKKRMLCLT